METKYIYTKLRKEFGKQPLFHQSPTHFLDSINPDVTLQREYTLRNPSNMGVEATHSYSEHEINTPRVNLVNTGVNHSEGGWPTDVNHIDEEQTLRYRYRMIRENNYVHAVTSHYPHMMHYLEQNNSIDMYHMYFKRMPQQLSVEAYRIRKANVYRDPFFDRPISCLAWTAEEDSKLVVVYCNTKYPVLSPLNKHFNCCLWHIEKPNEPYFTIKPERACWQIACAPTNSNLLVAGLENGKVCVFDIRESKRAVASCPAHVAHRDPVSAVLFINSRFGTEFFSGSSDGQCLWWDTRNMSEPTAQMNMTIRSPEAGDMGLENSEGVTSLQYDRSFPTRFLCGTETGRVVNVNRKGRSHSDIMSSMFHAHNGPVKALHRSPCISKMFITCGDWTVRIWNDDIRSAPIMTEMPSRYQITDVAWAPHRFSSYMTVSMDGTLRSWDLLRKAREPVTFLRICKQPLLRIKPHDDGKLVAVGNVIGSVYLLELSEDLVVSGPSDKQFMVQMYERESRREHILENRLKEIRLKQRVEKENLTAGAIYDTEEEMDLQAVEREYRKDVLKYKLVK